MASFGEYVRRRRLSRKIPFSEFCLRADVEPVEWSRVERERIPPPARERLRQVADVLGLHEGEEDWREFFELAQKDAGLPIRPLTDAELPGCLPVLFRTHPEESRHGGDDSQELLDDMKDLLKKAL